MGKRLEIAIVYNNSKDWIGGTYYIQNLISALNYAKEEDKPVLNIYCNSEADFEKLKEITGYELMQFHYHTFEKSLCVRAINYLRYLLSPMHYNAIGAIDLTKTEDIFLFPARFRTIVKPQSKALAWIPDFQDKYYPQFFTKEQLRQRTNLHKALFLNNIPIVFSSNDSLKDLYKFYPEAKDYKNVFVLPFAVTHPSFSEISIDSLKKKFNIKGEYLFCANQFWIHKNHKLLFESFANARKKGCKLELVCTGNIYDHRFKDYGENLVRFISRNGIESEIKLVGFISREEQLCLMKNSYAVVQPSLFEGWSTVVEDAKSLNKFIFLSDIPVHREQNPSNVSFFNPSDSDDLAIKLLTVKPSSNIVDYEENIRRFASNIIKIIKESIGS